MQPFRHQELDPYFTVVLQWNLWIAALRNKDILWNKNTSSGPKLLFTEQFAPWIEDTSELGTLLAHLKGVLISQVSRYVQNATCLQLQKDMSIIFNSLASFIFCKLKTDSPQKTW
jgi:hypothetical protein